MQNFLQNQLSGSLVTRSEQSRLFFFFLSVLGLHCCAQAFSSCGECGLLSSCGVWALGGLAQ